MLHVDEFEMVKLVLIAEKEVVLIYSSSFLSAGNWTLSLCEVRWL